MQSNLNNIYYISVILTFVLSLYLAFKKINRQQEYIYFYLFFTIVNDIIIAKTQVIGQNIAIFIYTLFSIVYFFKVYLKKSKIRLIQYAMIILTVGVIIFGIVSQFKIGFQVLNINFLLWLAIYYIILTLQWFSNRVMEPHSGKISEDFTFWISCSLLLWGCFFIFRILPTYLFDSRDPKFLVIVQNIFTVINIITYWILFGGLLKIYKNYATHRD